MTVDTQELTILELPEMKSPIRKSERNDGPYDLLHNLCDAYIETPKKEDRDVLFERIQKYITKTGISPEGTGVQRLRTRLEIKKYYHTQKQRVDQDLSLMYTHLDTITRELDEILANN